MAATVPSSKYNKQDQSYYQKFRKRLEYVLTSSTRVGTKRLSKLNIDDLLEDNIQEPSHRSAKVMKYLRKHEREISEQKRKEMHDKKISSYLAQRKKRETFRENLIKIIMGQEKDQHFLPETCQDDLMMSPEEMELLRYYYYIMYGIDDTYVSPMDEDMLQNILKLISPAYKLKYKSTLNELIGEAQEDYKLSIKKAVVDFVLKEHFINAAGVDEKNELSNENQDFKNFPAEHKTEFTKTRIKLSKQLILYHPCMRKVLNIWFREFDIIKLANMEKFKSQMSYDSFEFGNEIADMIKEAKKFLFKNWLPRVLFICQKAEKDGNLPPKMTKLHEKFWNCLATIMEHQLQRLCLKSIADYMDLLKEIDDTKSGFILNAIIKQHNITFEPSFELFANTLHVLLNSFTSAILSFPRVETKFYQDDGLRNLKPTVLNELIEHHSSMIFNLVEENKHGPQSVNLEFDIYTSLINDDEKKIVEDFLKVDPQHSFDEYAQLIKKYHELSLAIPSKHEHTIFIGLFEVRRKKLLDHMISIANKLKQDLLTKMVLDYQLKSKA